MIRNFSYVTEDGIVLKLNLGIGVDQFQGNDESKVSSFFKGQGKGVRWCFGENVIKILKYSKKIEGYPTPDLKRAVIIYPYDDPDYSKPGNAVIYNADGSIHLKLKVPVLISPIAKERKSRMQSLISDASFSFASWSKDSQGNIVIVLQIDFDWEWWESRVLNPDTGEFGECISSGRR